VLGFKLVANFDRPYFSHSITEFWKRWHISLSSWFRDYLYIPLGGNKVPVPRWYFNLLLVFVVSGLWHGANWTFIIWGLLHGFYLVFAISTKQMRIGVVRFLGLGVTSKPYRMIQILVTFSLVTFAWIFFRANSLSDAFLIAGRVFNFKGPLYIGEVQQFAYCISGILFLLFVEAAQKISIQNYLPFKSKNWFTEQLAYAMLIMLILMAGVFDGSQFIYFQF
jgi:D-alanyl-lipoteichoic acid acyltransferase DltB (MBOAT superfamily)